MASGLLLLRLADNKRDMSVVQYLTDHKPTANMGLEDSDLMSLGTAVLRPC